MASAIWQHGFQDDPYNPDQGARYWSECLAHGGGKPSHLILSSYLGRPLQPAALAGSLLWELDSKAGEVRAALGR